MAFFSPQSYSPDRMGQEPIPKLLLSISLPIMCSMLMQALYNVVDSIFVAHISEAALTSVSLSSPIQNLMIAMTTGLGVGMNSQLSKHLGEKDPLRAGSAAKNGIFLQLCAFLLSAIFGTIFAKPFMAWQTNDAEIITYGTAYLQICCAGSIGMFVSISAERLLQSTGRTVYSMLTQLIGVVTNLILNPLLVFGLLGFPRLEVAGAALATVIGQTVAAIAGFAFNLSKNKEININPRGFRPDWGMQREILTVSIPSMIMTSLGSIMIFFMNRILIAYSTTACAILGVYFKLENFFFMPLFGLNNGMVPVMAYNYGARNKARVREAYRVSMIYGLAIMGTGWLLLELFPGAVLLLFNASPDMLELGKPALRIIALCFIPAAITIVNTSVFQSLGNGTYCLTTSFIRQLIVMVPAAWLLSYLTGNVLAVYAALPIAEIVATPISCLFLIHIFRTRINVL